MYSCKREQTETRTLNPVCSGLRRRGGEGERGGGKGDQVVSFLSRNENPEAFSIVRISIESQIQPFQNILVHDQHRAALDRRPRRPGPHAAEPPL